MNKLDVQHPSLTYPSDFPVVQLAEEIGSVSAELKPAGRLIVLIPPEADYASRPSASGRLRRPRGCRFSSLVYAKNLRRNLVFGESLLRWLR